MSLNQILSLFSSDAARAVNAAGVRDDGTPRDDDDELREKHRRAFDVAAAVAPAIEHLQHVNHDVGEPRRDICSGANCTTDHAAKARAIIDAHLKSRSDDESVAQQTRMLRFSNRESKEI